MGILLGLATALAWGSSDFLARYATRGLGTLRALFCMQAFGATFLTIFLLATGRWGHLFDGSGWRPWAWGIAVGVCNSLGMLAFYRCIELGKLSVVAPLSASYPVLTLLLTVTSGERLTLTRICGIAATLLGVILVARGEAGPGSEARNAKQGIIWALCASLAFGVMYWILGLRVIETTGAYATVWLIRLTGASITFSLLLLSRATFPKGQASSIARTVGMGFLDTGAFVLSNRGMQMEQVSVVTVLSSLYGAVTVVLAAILIRERVSRVQWLGIVAIFAGIILISR
jgi:drug/metabolite transporter (DMT)-like permease